MKKIIIIVVAVLVLAGAGIAAYIFLGSDSSGDAAETAGAEVGQAEELEQEEEPIYMPLDPAFVVNFEHNGGIRYLQLSLQIMAYDQAVLDKVAANIPAVRNNLIMLFSGQDYDYLTTLEGKENLRQEVRASINQVVRFKDKSGVNEVFFTGFVMQ